MFRLPVAERLEGAERVLVSGTGGGYDVMGAVPLVIELLRAGKSVHLGSLTFSNEAILPSLTRVPGLPNLVSVTGRSAVESSYGPEAWLAEWLQRIPGGPSSVWLFESTGVQPLRDAYRHVLEEAKIDTVILVDGGIDATLRGDETSIGTPSEDLASVAAVAGLPVRGIVAALGMSAELRERISHAQFLRRVAELTKVGGFLGSYSLDLATEAGRRYHEAVQFVFSKQVNVKRSHINKSVSSALEGAFGSVGPSVWLSPLLTFVWFFDLPVLARTNLFVEAIERMETAFEVVAMIEGLRKNLAISDHEAIPL